MFKEQEWRGQTPAQAEKDIPESSWLLEMWISNVAAVPSDLQPLQTLGGAHHPHSAPTPQIQQAFHF
jgi:hypothetical protein